LNSFPDKFKEINPVYCMPQYVIDKLKLRVQFL
jgi:prenyltransferase beta subunit